MNSSRCRSFTDITNSLNDDDLSMISPSFSDSDTESDISDAYVPPRSPSRLGFTFADIGGNEIHVGADKQERLKWTYSLFQKKKQTSSKEYFGLDDQNPMCVDLASCASNPFGLLDDEPNSDEDDAQTILIPPRNSDSPFTRNISPETFPPCLTPAPSVSSVLSHCPDTQTPPSHTKPSEFSNHGLSKSSLMHQKWFWSTRYDDWVMWEAQNAQANAATEAYGGMAILPGTCPALSRSRIGPFRTTPPPSPPPAPNPHIFPRLGDIAALRDPYSVNIDRCFCHFPLWTMHKTLYMFDMHHRSTTSEGKSLGKAPGYESLSLSDEGLNVAEDVSLSSDFSDSDVTLVSENQSSISSTNTERLAEDSKKSAEEEEAEEVNTEFCTWDGVRAWEISWYARWELLVELVKRDEILRNASTDVFTPHEPVQPPPMFFFEGEEDGEDEDEDDYGTIVSTSFRGTHLEAGFGRAQEFFALNNNVDVRSGGKMICV